MRRREFITLLGGAAASRPLVARAQQPERKRRIGVLMGLGEGDLEAKARLAAFRQALEGLGWSESRNVQIDYRYVPAASSGQLQAIAKELIALEPDVILAHSTTVVAALKREAGATPIVFVVVSDPIGWGFVESFARPGGNITGFTNMFEATIGGKWLALLKEMAPFVTQVGLILNRSTSTGHYLQSSREAAKSLDVEAVDVSFQDAAELERAIEVLARKPNVGLIVQPDISITSNRQLVVSLVNRHRLPAIYPFNFLATDGGLMSYGIDTRDIFRRAASYVDRILKGEKPTNLPVQAPVKYELVINLKTAKALGLEVPPTLLARAEEVIE